MIKKYCIYFPYRLDLEELKNITDYDKFYTAVKNYLVDDENLDDNLQVVRKFIRFNKEDQLILLRKNNKIFVIIFSREGYKPFNILPVINDLERNQFFIAISLNWIELNEISSLINYDTNNIINVDDKAIQQLYEINKHSLYPLIEQSLFRLFFQNINTY